jgi:hypothetical protein
MLVLVVSDPYVAVLATPVSVMLELLPMDGAPATPVAATPVNDRLLLLLIAGDPATPAAATPDRVTLASVLVDSDPWALVAATPVRDRLLLLLIVGDPTAPVPATPLMDALTLAMAVSSRRMPRDNSCRVLVSLAKMGVGSPRDRRWKAIGYTDVIRGSTQKAVAVAAFTDAKTLPTNSGVMDTDIWKRI